jgi:hypothetical protein
MGEASGIFEQRRAEPLRLTLIKVEDAVLPHDTEQADALESEKRMGCGQRC